MTFDAVVGQDTVTTTLKNAIKSKHLAQAYLFCGPRGVGKTTCARILAKTINCDNITDNVEACDQCESCKSFNEWRSFNIHELDAASNNSVDDIRNLIDQVRIPPQVGRYSTYIIDEVHMLSAQAFNAFLKTLEEPPAHAIFILATTEKHKIIPTILSRCQIFDFNRIRLDDIVKRLQFVAGKESIQTDEDALHIIALKADGAMRDALSIFDQIVSFSGNHVGYQNVIENLNVLDYEYYFKLTDTFLHEDVSGSLLLLDEIINKGFDPHHLITGLSSHLRDLLVCNDPETISLLEAGASFKERYVAQSKACDTQFLFKALEALSLTDTQFRSSRNPRLLTELTLIRCCRMGTQDTTGKKKTESHHTPEKRAVNRVEEPRSASKVDREPEDIPKNIPSEIAPSETHPPVKKDAIPPDGDSAPSGTVTPETSRAKITIPPEAVELPKKTGNEVLVKASKPTTTGQPAPPGSYKSQTPSIKDGLNGLVVRNGTEEITPDTAGKSRGDLPFTLDQLVGKWLDYSEKIKQDKPRLATTLRTQIPRLEDKWRVIVEMENANQKEDFVTYLKPDIQKYLRETLRNDRISINAIITESGPTDNKPYTDEEKFKYLSDKNPNLNLLKNKLGLDFE